MTGAHGGRRFARVDRNSALRELPTMHAVALRLHDHGCTSDVIAAAVGIDGSQVATFLDVANAKLLNVQARDQRDESSSSSAPVG